MSARWKPSKQYNSKIYAMYIYHLLSSIWINREEGKFERYTSIHQQQRCDFSYSALFGLSDDFRSGGSHFNMPYCKSWSHVIGRLDCRIAWKFCRWLWSTRPWNIRVVVRIPSTHFRLSRGFENCKYLTTRHYIRHWNGERLQHLIYPPRSNLGWLV